MSRTCNRAERSFSAMYDGSVAPADRAEFDAHLAACDACRESFSGFVRAMSDLATLRPAIPVADAFVAQVMARVDRAGTESGAGRVSGVMVPPPRAGWRRVGSHLCAAAIGAAAAIAIAPRFGSDTRDPEVDPSSPIVKAPVDATSPSVVPHDRPVELPIRFVGHSATIERNGRVETNTPAFKFRAGETLRSLPSQRVALTLEDSGELVLHLEAVDTPTPPPPPPPVHELTFVDMPSLVTVDRRLVTDAVDDLERRVARGFANLDFEKSVSSVSALVHAAAARARELRAQTTEPSPAADAPAESTEPTVAVSTYAIDPSPVIIQSSAEQTRLAVQGTLHEIIPELISLLDDSDRDVADLAAERLAAIRAELEADSRVSSILKPFPPAVEPTTPSSGPARLGRWLRTSLGADVDAPRELNTHERWRRWWQENAIAIATGHPAADA